jgi:hypothetical protein
VGSDYPIKSKCLVIGELFGRPREGREHQILVQYIRVGGQLLHAAAEMEMEMEMGGLFLRWRSSPGEAPALGDHAEL